MINQPSSLGAAPPNNFRRKHEVPVVYAECTLQDGTFHSTKGHSPAQAAGLRYERKVYTYLKNWHRCFAQVPVSFSYGKKERVNIIRPDLLISDLQVDSLICCEIKRQHTGEAEQQLAYYRPVLEKAFKLPIGFVEICHSLPPRSTTGKYNILRDRHDLYALRRDQHNILVLSDYELRLGLGGLKDGLELDIGAAEAPLR